MGVAEIFDVRDELIAELAVGQPSVVVFRNTAPGAEMNFIDGNRGSEPVFLRPMRDPVGVGPFMVIESRDDSGSRRDRL